MPKVVQAGLAPTAPTRAGAGGARETAPTRAGTGGARELRAQRQTRALLVPLAASPGARLPSL